LKKIIVSTNCQTAGVFESLSRHLRGFVVTALPQNRLKKRIYEPEEFNNSIVLYSNSTSDSIIELKKQTPFDSICIPEIQFSAFHPDLTYAFDKRTNSITNYHWNSRIVAWSYNHDIPVEKVVSLFRWEVYEKLNYFNVWANSVERLRKIWMATDLSNETFEAFFLSAKRSGIFMHGINHPTAAAFDSLCRLILKKFFYLTDFKPSMIDTLSGNIFPVYPDIARNLSVAGGGYCWRVNGILLDGLRDFVAWAFRGYTEQNIRPGDLVVSEKIDGIDEILFSSL